MSLSLFTFLRLFCCVYLVTSAAHAQSGVCNDDKLKTKISYFEDKIDELTVRKKSLMEELNRSKERENELRNEIDSIGKANCSSGSQRIDQLSADLNGAKQQVSQLLADLNGSREQNEELKGEIEAMKRELIKLTSRNSPMEKSVSVTKPSIHFRLSDEYHTKEPDYTWTINTTAARMNRTEFELLSPVFPLKGYPVGGQARLTLKENYFYIRLAYKNLYENALEFKIAPNVHFTFKGQNTSDVTRHYTSPFKASLHYDTFYYERGVSLSPYEAIEVHVEGPWVIDEYWKKRQMEKDQLVYYQISPYFYTGPRGYRVQANIRLNGEWDHKCKGILVTMDFVSGPYDKGLNASFPHRTTFTILHPTDPTKHLVKSVEANIDKRTWYYIEVSTHEEIEKLIENDTLFYQINIDPIEK